MSFGGADIRWEATQLVNKHLDSIECTNHALDEGIEVKYSPNAEVVQIYFSLKNIALKMQIASMALDVICMELASGEDGVCWIVISRIEFEEEHQQANDNVKATMEMLEKKLRTDFAEIFRKFMREKIASTRPDKTR